MRQTFASPGLRPERVHRHTHIQTDTPKDGSDSMTSTADTGGNSGGVYCDDILGYPRTSLVLDVKKLSWADFES